MENYFFIIFFLTVLITRLFLYYYPFQSPMIREFRMHHWMHGIIIVAISFLLHSWILYAIGLGLFIDELTFILMRGNCHEHNYSLTSIVGTVCFVIIFYFLQGYALIPFS